MIKPRLRNLIVSALAAPLLLGACGGSTEVAGISDDGGCGIFETNFEVDTFVQVIRNDCPFELTLRFIIEQDGCKLTLQDAGPNGEDLPGVVNQQGFYGVEVKNEGTIYDCQGDAVADADRGTYRLDCEFDATTCRIEADPL